MAASPVFSGSWGRRGRGVVGVRAKTTEAETRGDDPVVVAFDFRGRERGRAGDGAGGVLCLRLVRLEVRGEADMRGPHVSRRGVERR